jgi:hypothetical protein
MVQLVLFLTYLALIVAFVWQLVRLIREPSTRSLPRLLFVLAAGAVLAFIVYYGVLQ